MRLLTMSLTTLQATRLCPTQVSLDKKESQKTKRASTIFSAGKKTTMMSTRNFYNAMTPGSHLGEEVMFGKSAYKQIAPSELNSKYVREANKMPVARDGSLLNAINDHGLLSYTDFHFLLLLMSTPTRYLDIIFHGFDISADGSVEAKVTITSLASTDPSMSVFPSLNP